jgi:glycosyltransferase involved in cell wall biosynthesis
MKLSVIIANHNYRDFIGAAIESALAIEWPDKEVIVVDDASTDDSRTVIDRFSGRVAAYFRLKSNQFGAHIFGFEQSTGDILIFLDADDLLEPGVMREVAKAWRPGVSKVQYRMNLIDAADAQLGSAIPQFPRENDPERLRSGFLRTMAYTTPPGTGNAYSRDFVNKAYAMGPWKTQWTDNVLLTLAPLLGDVLTIKKPLARYRLHGANKVSLGSLDAGKFRDRLREDVEKAGMLAAVAERLLLPVGDDLLNQNVAHLQYRLASFVVEPAAHPFPEDTILGLFKRLASSMVAYSEMPLRDRVILIGWAIGCALLPRSLARTLVLWRFAPTSRPAAMRAVLGTLGSLRSARLPRTRRTLTIPSKIPTGDGSQRTNFESAGTDLM